MPCWYRYSAASATSTSPASEATTGFSIPLARISATTSTISFAKTIGGGMMVGQKPRCGEGMLGARRLAAGDVHGISGCAERRNDLAECRVEVRGHRHQ